ncbi:hypothetical protein [Streptomyces sp. NPDC058254]|uniref:hypothetical protein n=1 Tax=Streptomyces sp. NPDC058254 TaxID=3346406 RepID=UPI0036E50FF4
MTTLNFVLQGRDALSRTLNNVGDSADRLRNRLDRMANDSSRQLAGFTRDADGRMRDLQGRFLSAEEAARRLSAGMRDMPSPFADASSKASKFGEELRASLISLAPAAIPAAAGLAGAAATVAAQLGAAGLASAAFMVALKPQTAAIGEAVKAQDKYKQAVQASGKNSAEAVKAQAAYQQQLDAMPPATQRAAVAVGMLRDNFQEWSDSLSGDVMGPFTKGVAVANALLPKTTGLVKASSTQFDRLITMVGGAIQTPGFDRLSQKVTEYADRTMTRAVSSTTQFLARLDTGQVGGGLQQFLDYARQQGPIVGDTLRNVGDALINVLNAGSEVGVGMLQVINALSGIVSAVPPGAIAAMLQLAIAIKAVRLAAVGAGAARAALAGLVSQVLLMRTASMGAPGAIQGVTAAIGSLSKGAKLAMAGTGIGLLLLAVGSLSEMGQKASPDVEKLTTSVGKLGQTGKVSGEAVRAYGKDLSGLADSLRTLARPSNAEGIQQWLTSLIGMDSTPVKNAKEDLDAVDKALANLVSQGKGDLAAAAFDNIAKAMSKQGMSSKELRGELDNYKSALAGQRLEQELAAQSMGLFGQQSIEVQAKLDAQKASADGLRQSIQALNDTNRSALGGMIGFEAAIDAAAEAAKKNAGALDMQGGKLVLNSDKSRAAATALNDLAGKTDSAAASAREGGASWSTVNGIYERGRQQLIKNAIQMGLTEGQAKRLADQILKTPDKTAKLKGNAEDLKQKIADAKARLAKVPDSRKAQVRAEIAQLMRELAKAKRELASVKSRSVTVTVTRRTVLETIIKGPQTTADALRKQAENLKKHAGGGLIGRANGGPIPGYPGGGRVRGPGTSTSDSVLMWGSNGEYMIKAASVAKYGLKFMDAVNAGKLPVRAGRAASPGLAAAPPVVHRPADDRAPVTYNVYPRSSVIDAQDLRLIQRQEEARQRVGRPR